MNGTFPPSELTALVSMEPVSSEVAFHRQQNAHALVLGLEEIYFKALIAWQRELEVWFRALSIGSHLTADDSRQNQVAKRIIERLSDEDRIDTVHGDGGQGIMGASAVGAIASSNDQRGLSIGVPLTGFVDQSLAENVDQRFLAVLFGGRMDRMLVFIAEVLAFVGGAGTELEARYIRQIVQKGLERHIRRLAKIRGEDKEWEQEVRETWTPEDVTRAIIEVNLAGHDEPLPSYEQLFTANPFLRLGWFALLHYLVVPEDSDATGGDEESAAEAFWDHTKAQDRVMVRRGTIAPIDVHLQQFYSCEERLRSRLLERRELWAELLRSTPEHLLEPQERALLDPKI